MSLGAMSWVLEHSEARLGDRLVLLVLAEYAWDDGSKSFPAVETIAAKARLSKRQAQRALRSLIAEGRVIETGVSEYGTKVYDVVLQEGGDNLTPPDKSDTEGRQIGPESGSDLSPDPSSTNPSSTQGDERAENVWRYWLAARKPKVTKLAVGTASQIKRALNAGFEVEDLCRAIDGLLASDWHREHGKLQLSTIFTTGPGTQSFEDRIQSFIDKAPGSSHQPRNGRDVPPTLRSALIAARDHPRSAFEGGRWVTGDAVTDARYAHAVAEALDRFELRVAWAGENHNKLRFEEVK